MSAFQEFNESEEQFAEYQAAAVEAFGPEAGEAFAKYINPEESVTSEEVASGRGALILELVKLFRSGNEADLEKAIEIFFAVIEAKDDLVANGAQPEDLILLHYVNSL